MSSTVNLIRVHNLEITHSELTESYLKLKFDTSAYKNQGFPDEQEIKTVFKTVKKEDMYGILKLFNVESFKDLKGKKASLTYYIGPRLKVAEEDSNACLYYERTKSLAYLHSLTEESNNTTEFSFATYQVVPIENR